MLKHNTSKILVMAIKTRYNWRYSNTMAWLVDLQIHLEHKFPTQKLCTEISTKVRKEEKICQIDTLPDHWQHRCANFSDPVSLKTIQLCQIHTKRERRKETKGSAGNPESMSCCCMHWQPCLSSATLVWSSCLTKHECVPPTARNILRHVIILECYFLGDVSVQCVS